jgi:dTDP-4-dehydrorhamnose 3,5-epimerase
LVVLHDIRPSSPTFGKTQSFVAGGSARMVVSIPPGVAHGYKVIGQDDMLILYLTSETYDKDRPDEYRIPHDDPSIGFDWTVK